MALLELQQSEQDMLLEILDEDLKRLNLEITKTDDRHFREALGRRRKTIENIRKSLNALVEEEKIYFGGEI